jgi:hypothetical protein
MPELQKPTREQVDTFIGAAALEDGLNWHHKGYDVVAAFLLGVLDSYDETVRDAARYRWLVAHGPPGVHTYVTGLHPSERSSSLVDSDEFDAAVDARMAECGPDGPG